MAPRSRGRHALASRSSGSYEALGRITQASETARTARGEADKAFAVVADEVKNLANQTHKATEDISQRITRVQSETQEAVQAIETITGSVKEIDLAASSIASAMEQQNASTQEIARTIEEASKGAKEVTETIAQVTEAANRTGAYAEEVLATSKDPDTQSSTFQQNVEGFVGDIRAA